MGNNIKVVCFHTPTGIYPTMADRLKQSCSALNVPIQIDVIDDAGSWVKNCGYKSEYIRQKLLETNDGDCILWLDADARLMAQPTMLINCKEDFAIHARPGGTRIKPAGREEISLPAKWNLSPMWFESGTILVRRTPQVLVMVELWQKLTADGNKWDQWTLQEAWTEIQPPTLWLPRSYCQIHKLHGDKDAVILHDLASVIQRVNRL